LMMIKLLSSFVVLILIQRINRAKCSGSECATELCTIKEKLHKYYVLKAQSAKCGNWISTYQQLKEPNRHNPSIVLIPHTSGIADRILGTATAFFVALLTRRSFQIGQRDGLPYFDLVFEPNGIDWRREKDPLWLVEPLIEGAQPRNYNESILQTKQYNAVNTIEQKGLQDMLLHSNLTQFLGEDYQTVFLSLNKGRVLKIYDNPCHKDDINRFNMSKRHTFGCFVDFLFKPRPEIFLPVFKQFDIMTSKSIANAKDDVLKIGIQIRVGDWYWTNTQHHVDLDRQFYMFFDCAEQIEAFVRAGGRNFTSVVWYLITESMPLRLAAITKYGSKVVTALNTSIEHSSKEKSVCKEANCTVSVTGFQTAAAEWWLFALAEFHVISRFSGFGRSAAMRSSNHSIYTIVSPRNNGVGVQKIVILV